MIRFNYEKDAVVAMFFLLRHKIRPTEADLLEFDQGLKEANEQLLQEHMAASGLDPGDMNAKSQILLLSQKAPGSSAADQIRNAVQFYINTRGI